MKNKNSGLSEILSLCVGEIAVSALTVLGFLLLNLFTYKVITGVVLGSLVAILNYAFLVITLNRAADRFMELRGEGEMDDEEAEKFAAEHAMEFQNISKLSFVIRTFTMLGALVVAFLTKQFDVVATVIPLLCFQPILIISQSLKNKRRG